MKDRIRKFMDYISISPVELADLLEVQRSNISHILNGRNKPGALFLEKFLKTFPQADARWLLTGEGEMIVGGGGGNGTTQGNSVQAGGKEVIKAGQDGSQPETELSPPGQGRASGETGYSQPEYSNATQSGHPKAENHPFESGHHQWDQKHGQPAGGRGEMKVGTDQALPAQDWKDSGRDQQEVRSEPDVAYGKKPVKVPSEKIHSDRQIEKVIILRADGTFIAYDAG